MCYSVQIAPTILNQWTRLKKGIISCFKDNDVTTLKKHVDVDHGLMPKKLRKKWIITWKVQLKANLQKRLIIILSAIFNCFGIVDFFKKDNVQ
jgi:mRNA-degrading endonuclease RelE of RelBE toxin-antitoxin system